MTTVSFMLGQLGPYEGELNDGKQIGSVRRITFQYADSLPEASSIGPIRITLPEGQEVIGKVVNADLLKGGECYMDFVVT